MTAHRPSHCRENKHGLLCRTGKHPESTIGSQSLSYFMRRLRREVLCGFESVQGQREIEPTSEMASTAPWAPHQPLLTPRYNRVSIPCAGLTPSVERGGLSAALAAGMGGSGLCRACGTPLPPSPAEVQHPGDAMLPATGTARRGRQRSPRPGNFPPFPLDCTGRAHFQTQH